MSGNGGYHPPEETLGKVYDRRMLGRIITYVRPYRFRLGIAFTLALMIALVDVTLPFLTKTGIDRYILFKNRVVAISSDQPDLLSRFESVYGGVSDNIGAGRWVIPDGKLDPKDRKLFSDANVIEPDAYFRIDPERYRSSDVRAIIERESEGLLSATRGGIHFIRADRMEALTTADRLVLRNPDIRGVARIAGLYLLLLLISFSLMFSQVYLMEWIGQHVMFDIRTRLFNHIQRLPMQFFNTQPVGRLVTRVSNDVNGLNEMFTSIIVDIFKNLFMLVGIVVMMYLMAPRLATVTFALLPVIIAVTWVFKQKMRDAYREVRVKIALINATLAEHFSGVRIIRGFAREAIHFGKFSVFNHECYSANMRQLIVQSSFSPAVILIENFGIALILYYGGGQVVQQTLTLGTLVAFLSYVSMFFGPIRDIAEKFNVMQSAMASSERIFQIIDKDEEDLMDPPGERVEPDTIRGAITFDRVWFAYEGDDWVLRDVSFTVNPGETVALVGATGSGKTTVINLLSKFFRAQKGTIRIDGLDLDAIDRRALRRAMAIVLQDVFLFSGDILTNIRLNDTSISESTVRHISELVCADRFIARLPGTYQHVLEEGGGGLSQGQRQLLAFARALVHDPSILVLDEATANIDSETERWIQEALETMLERRTSVVVAHRLSTIKKADRIIVLHRGRIREEGTHAELLARKGIYYKLYQLQYRHQDLA